MRHAPVFALPCPAPTRPEYNSVLIVKVECTALEKNNGHLN